MLLEACQQTSNITLLNDKQVVSIENQDNDVQVCCADESIYEAKAVVGADGLWSTTRSFVSDDEPVGAEYVAYRGTHTNIRDECPYRSG